MQDLNRGVIKSDKATVSIPSLEFEIPPGTQAGVYTTVEGVITKCCDDLAAVSHHSAPCRVFAIHSGCVQGQDGRREVSQELHDQVDAFITKLRGLVDPANMPYKLVLDDPSGNSFVENPVAPKVFPVVFVAVIDSCTRR